MTSAIITVFVLGYLLIAVESLTKINKAAIAIIMGVVCWSLLVTSGLDFLDFNIGTLEGLGLMSDGLKEEAANNAQGFLGSEIFRHYLAEVCETVLFLMGAMTVVETVDSHGGFRFVKNVLYTPNPKVLLWKVVGMTFILSALLDNMTSSIVMVMVLRSLVQERDMRLKFAGIIILAANAGGAFSPIGDVTTIMLWIHKNVSTIGIITGILIPSILNILVPALCIMPTLKGHLAQPVYAEQANAEAKLFRPAMRNVILAVGVGGLVLVPVFHGLTGLPPFMGVFGVMGLLWLATEIIIAVEHADDEGFETARVSHMIRKIDMSTIFFFTGILLAVDALSATGTLKALGIWLENSVGNVYVINGLIGIFSSVIDNVPLVASAMGMYPVADAAMVAADPAMINYVQDGLFWECLAYCAGTGGSILIIGSAAGVVVMGLEKISFIWYLKKFSVLALIGYFAGLVWYWFEKAVLAGWIG